MENLRNWEWLLSAGKAGVILSGGRLRWWYAPLDSSGMMADSQASYREQAVEEFKQHGPSTDAVTQDEIDYPEEIENLYSPFWVHPWVERNGPRVDEIPAEVLAELCAALGCRQSDWRARGAESIEHARPAPRPRRTARLKRHPFIKRRMLSWLNDDKEAALAEKAVDAIFALSYGYSDRDTDMKRVVPEVFDLCMPLVHNLGDFLALCAAIPGILRALPEDSQETILGYVHTYDLSTLASLAKRSAGVADLLKKWEDMA